MIFAAGLGTRLLHLTQDRPKALVLLKGKPLLQYVIEKIWAAGIFDIVINVHHFGQQIIDFVEGMDKPKEARFYISDERNLLRDTGGGLAYAMRSFGVPNEDWLVHNTDVWSDFPLQTLIDKHKTQASTITLLVQARQSSRYLLFDHQHHLQGWLNNKTGDTLPPNINVADYQKKAFNGIHIVNTSILNYLPRKDVFPIIPAYIAAAQKIKIYGLEHGNLMYKDLGKPEALDNMDI